jgi:DNA-binding NtrC family response regulator
MRPDDHVIVMMAATQVAPMPPRRGGAGAACPGMPDQLPLAGKSILVIEDQSLIAMSVEYSLNDAGAATVTIASSVAQARAALMKGPYDAAVVDFRLPDGDASVLINVLSEREIPVVVTTGDSFAQPHLSKTVTVLEKPYSDRDLIKVMTWLTRMQGERDP